jgi:argininosuccinate synthase
MRDAMTVKIADRVYYCIGYAPQTLLMRRLLEQTHADGTGEVRLKLSRGTVIVAGRRAPRSLYNERLATFEADTIYNQRDAEGFIKLNALRLRSLAQASK